MTPPAHDQCDRRVGPRRGQYPILLALCMTSLLGFSALAVDLPYAMLVGEQLQAGLDSAAHAGALRLDGTDDGLAAAESTALAFAAQHQAGTQVLSLAPNQVTFGLWEDGEFIDEEDPALINAIRVEQRVPVRSLVGGAVFERGVESVEQSAIGMTLSVGAAATECFLPLAIPSCLIDDYGKEGVQMVDLVLNPAGTDNVGWARPESNPTASWARDQVTDCEQDGEVAIGDDLRLNNGVMDDVLQEMADAIASSETGWDAERWGAQPAAHASSGVSPSAYGGTLEGPLMLFDDDSYCSGSGGRWNGTQPVSGFAWAAVYDVATKGPVAQRTIRVRLDTTGTHRVGTRTGGVDNGVQGPGGAVLTR